MNSALSAVTARDVVEINRSLAAPSRPRPPHVVCCRVAVGVQVDAIDHMMPFAGHLPLARCRVMSSADVRRPAFFRNGRVSWLSGSLYRPSASRVRGGTRPDLPARSPELVRVTDFRPARGGAPDGAGRELRHDPRSPGGSGGVATGGVSSAAGDGTVVWAGRTSLPGVCRSVCSVAPGGGSRSWASSAFGCGRGDRALRFLPTFLPDAG